jgi:hypothetical protein
MELRRAGREAAEQVACITSGRSLLRDFPRVWEARNIVEAFPNAFLGVCVEDIAYRNMPRLRRGKKFDWLYDEWCRTGLFSILGGFVGIEGAPVVDACKTNSHHEERAALVCLLTAASVASGKYVAVGERLGGYFFMPPLIFWSAWAREELERQRQKFPAVDVWIDGVSFTSMDALPVVPLAEMDG